MTAFESYYNYEVHSTPARMWVRVEVSEDVWVEADVVDTEDGVTNVADMVTPRLEAGVIVDTLTVSPAHRSYGFAGAFLWDETMDAIDAALNAALAI